MTNIKQSLEKATPSGVYSDLAGKIGIPVSHLFEEVSQRLNRKGSRPTRLNRYTYNIVLNVYYGKYEDDRFQVKLEMEEMVAEKLGLTERLQPHFDAIRNALAEEV